MIIFFMWNGCLNRPELKERLVTLNPKANVEMEGGMVGMIVASNMVFGKRLAMSLQAGLSKSFKRWKTRCPAFLSIKDSSLPCECVV